MSNKAGYTVVAEGQRAALLSAYGVSRETMERLDVYVSLLAEWQQRTNLVGRGTLDAVWSRHILDSLQLLDHAPPGPSHWADLGTGAGFPGLVLAIAGGEAVRSVDLVESNGKKVAFLRRVIARTNAPAKVHDGRIEAVVPRLQGIDIVTARALAPLGQILEWSAPLLTTGAMGLFPKGRDAETELTEAARQWTFAHQKHPSRTDPEAAILEIRDLRRRSERPA